MVGAARCLHNPRQALTRQFVLLVGIDGAVVDTAHTQFQPVVEAAGADIEVERVFRLHGLIETGGAETAVDTFGDAVVIDVVVEGGRFVAGALL